MAAADPLLHPRAPTEGTNNEGGWTPRRWHTTNTREREPPIHTDLPLHELPAPNGAAVSLMAGVDDPNPKLESDTPKSVINSRSTQMLAAHIHPGWSAE